MKKTLLLATLIAMFGIASAQTEEGGWFISGASTFTFSNTKSEFNGAETTNSILNLSLQGGYFVINNLNVGLIGGYIRTRDEFDGRSFTFEQKLLGPYGRYYPISNFFFGVGHAWDLGAMDSSGSFILEAGSPIWITKSVSLEPGIAYTIGTGLSNGVNNFTIGFGFGVYIN